MFDGEIVDFIQLATQNATPDQATAIFAAINQVCEAGHGNVTIHVKDGHIDLLAVTKSVKINRL